MPEKPPYFPLYVKDFAADDKVEAMTTEAVGAYFLLLLKAWHQEPAGSIPTDDYTLSRWARLTPERWAELKLSVLAAFTSGTDGRYHQKRMRLEFNKLMIMYRGRREAGRRGAQRRWQSHSKANGKANSKNMAPDSDSDSSSSSKRKRRAGDDEGFAAFWAAYPRKEARKYAAECWARIKPDAALRAVILAALERQKRSAQWQSDGGRYIPHPSTWLNQRRWEDDVGPVAESLEQRAKRFYEEMQCQKSSTGSPGGPPITSGSSGSTPTPT